jgi:uncharacterized membrane protein
LSILKCYAKINQRRLDETKLKGDFPVTRTMALFAVPSFLSGAAATLDIGSTLTIYIQKTAMKQTERRYTLTGRLLAMILNLLRASGKKEMANNKHVAKKEQHVAHRQTSVTREYHHSGPLPDPITLQGYDQIMPGLANRIVMMTESQHAHRISMEKKVVNSGVRNSLMGIISGFLAVVIMVGAGVYLALNGLELGGAIIGTTGLAGLVGVFIYGTQSNRKERESKRM